MRGAFRRPTVGGAACWIPNQSLGQISIKPKMLNFKSLGLDLRITPSLSLPRAPHIPPGRPQIGPCGCLVGNFFRFLCLPKCLPNFASKNHGKKCENRGFRPPKTLPKSFQNASEIEVPTNMRFFIDFESKFDACCKSQHQKNVRTRNVLSTFHTIRLIALSMHFRSENFTENPLKTMSEPFKLRCKKHLVF